MVTLCTQFKMADESKMKDTVLALNLAMERMGPDK